MEARSEEEYEQHVRPFRGREWPNGLLRFSLYDDDDEAPLEAPNNVSTQQDEEDILMADFHGPEGTRRRPRRHEHRHGHHHGHHGHHHGHNRDHHRRGDLPPWPHLPSAAFVTTSATPAAAAVLYFILRHPSTAYAALFPPKPYGRATSADSVPSCCTSGTSTPQSALHATCVTR